MIEDAAMAVSTGAAGNIVAYLLNGRVDALRNHVVSIFRHGSDVEQSHALQALERDAVALVENDATRASLINQWRDLILSYFIAHPEAREEIESFAFLDTVGTTKIKSMKHAGTGPQIVGPNFGNMTFQEIERIK
jgi:hypothetical protein